MNKKNALFCLHTPTSHSSHRGPGPACSASGPWFWPHHADSWYMLLEVVKIATRCCPGSETRENLRSKSNTCRTRLPHTAARECRASQAGQLMKGSGISVNGGLAFTPPGTQRTEEPRPNQAAHLPSDPALALKTRQLLRGVGPASPSHTQRPTSVGPEPASIADRRPRRARVSLRGKAAPVRVGRAGDAPSGSRHSACRYQLLASSAGQVTPGYHCHFYQQLPHTSPSSSPSAQLSSAVQLAKHRSILQTCKELAQNVPTCSTTLQPTSSTFHGHHPAPLLRSNPRATEVSPCTGPICASGSESPRRCPSRQGQGQAAVGSEQGQSHLCAPRRHGYGVQPTALSRSAHSSGIPIQLRGRSPMPLAR